jgi:hypothetical protein
MPGGWMFPTVVLILSRMIFQNEVTSLYLVWLDCPVQCWPSDFLCVLLLFVQTMAEFQKWRENIVKKIDIVISDMVGCLLYFHN